MDVRIVRVLKRRHEDPSAGRPHLMHVVRELGLVDLVDLLDHQPRFFLREHEPVAVVVVPDVGMVEIWEAATVSRALQVVPVVDHHHLAVRVLGRDHEDDDVIEQFLDLGARLGCQTVQDLGECLCVADLGRVNRGVHEVHRSAFASQCLRVILGEAARIGEPAIDLDEPVEVGKILGGADRRHDIRRPECRLSEFFEDDAIGIACDMLEVFDDLSVPREFSIRADSDPKNCSGGWMSAR